MDETIANHVPAAPPEQTTDPWLIWKILAILLLLSIAGAAAGTPYQLAFVGEEVTASSLFVLALLFSMAFYVFLAAVAGALGLWLGKKVGLGAPILEAWLSGRRGAGKRFLSTLWVSTLVGLATGFVLIALILLVSAVLPAEIAALGDSEEAMARLTPLKGLGGSFMAGVIEEIWFRLGLMTFLAWLGSIISRRSPTPSGVFWVANVLAVLPFGLLHLSNVLALGGAVTWESVAYVVILNGVAAVVWGWLYWRRGIEAAMIAHFSTDIVLHVLPLLALGLLPT